MDEDAKPAAEQTVFQQQWQIYRTLVDENYLFHREAYACLHQVLAEQVARPFHFLDVACGDATASVGALTGTAVARYHGIDLSATALALARQSVAALACPATIEQADFGAALRAGTLRADVVWVGLSLHHLQTAEKLDVLRAVRRGLPDDGWLLIYENASPDGEDRAGWLRRWDDQRPAWTAYTPEGWATITAHVHAADFPETDARWRALAEAAGFGEVTTLFVAPSNLFRLYQMRPGDAAGAR